MRAVAAVVLLMTGVGSAALAQTSPQRPAAAPAPSPVPALAPPPAAPEQRPAQLVKTEVSYLDNWQVNCQEFVNPARRQCNAALQLVQTNPQTNTATVLINWLMAVTDNQLTATIQTPTGVLITPGIDLKIGRAVKKVAFTRCDGQRCESTFPLDDAASKDLAAADVVELSIRGGQNNPVTFNIPVKGYERALQALRAKP